ncbi:NEDD8-activating enzyme E1 catalytic subunit [Paramuricea clavata]|uniref:NEDD8-activating enzyme E1 catalytic subunit n=1 Tax=Paramuricea clavata TaxID=317549 RepID=A0A7D9EEE9_PARCT|nr:NEDD8-activating enzyme E1 catalytic subunit [Paramuricea clavata]
MNPPKTTALKTHLYEPIYLFLKYIVVDGDNPQHVQWIYEEALKSSEDYIIKRVTYRLIQGVIKHTIPAVASTNALLAVDKNEQSCTFSKVVNSTIILDTF